MADPLRIVLDGRDLEVRAYLASQVGPLRRPFGLIRPFPLAAGQSALVAEARGDFVLYVGIESTVSTSIAVSKSQQPGLGQQPTIAFTANVTFADFVLMPGDSLYVRVLAATTVIKTEVPF